MKKSRGVFVGLLANLFVLWANSPILRVPTDKPIRPMMLPIVYLFAEMIAVAIGLPLSWWSAKEGNKIGWVGVVLCLLPLPLGIVTLDLFASIHGVKFKP